MQRNKKKTGLRLRLSGFSRLELIKDSVHLLTLECQTKETPDFRNVFKKNMFGDARQGIISFDRYGTYPIGYILYVFIIFIPDVI